MEKNYLCINDKTNYFLYNKVIKLISENIFYISSYFAFYFSIFSTEYIW